MAREQQALLEELGRLAASRDAGQLSADEFDARVAKLLQAQTPGPDARRGGGEAVADGNGVTGRASSWEAAPSPDGAPPPKPVHVDTTGATTSMKVFDAPAPETVHGATRAPAAVPSWALDDEGWSAIPGSVDTPNVGAAPEQRRRARRDGATTPDSVVPAPTNGQSMSHPSPNGSSPGTPDVGTKRNGSVAAGVDGNMWSAAPESAAETSAAPAPRAPPKLRRTRHAKVAPADASRQPADKSSTARVNTDAPIDAVPAAYEPAETRPATLTPGAAMWTAAPEPEGPAPSPALKRPPERPLGRKDAAGRAAETRSTSERSSRRVLRRRPSVAPALSVSLADGTVESDAPVAPVAPVEGEVAPEVVGVGRDDFQGIGVAFLVAEPVAPLEVEPAEAEPVPVATEPTAFLVAEPDLVAPVEVEPAIKETEPDVSPDLPVVPPDPPVTKASRPSASRRRRSGALPLASPAAQPLPAEPVPEPNRHTELVASLTAATEVPAVPAAAGAQSPAPLVASLQPRGRYWDPVQRPRSSSTTPGTDDEPGIRPGSYWDPSRRQRVRVSRSPVVDDEPRIRQGGYWDKRSRRP